jgi:hypothetical protein
MDTLANDTISQLINVGLVDGNDNSNLWMYVALIEVMVIIGLILFRKKDKNERVKLKKKILSENKVDFSNVINSSFRSKTLYDNLKKQCHPDKYKDEALNAEATEIFQLLVKYRYDYNKLLELRERAVKNLMIN